MPSELSPSADLLEERLGERLPRLLADVRDRLLPDWPDYAAFLDADVEDIREGAAGMFLHRLVALATSGPPVGDALATEGTLQLVFEQIGRRQWELGHDLIRLLTAYQVGARVAWRHVAETAHELHLSPESIALLAESVFDFVNHLSQASTTGYVLAQGDDARARDRHRAELTELLLSSRSSPAAIRASADKARWRLPNRMAVVLTADAEDALGRVDPAALQVREGDLVGAIVPDPDGPRREQLRRALAGTTSVVGMTVGVDLIARSVELAQIALGLAATGVLRGRPIFVDEHLDTIIVHRDDRLLSFLRQQVLAPLDGLPVRSRERLTETLVVWLRHQGDRTAVAGELHVHPQTVSYRLGRLRELFGAALDDPRERSRLLLALNWSPVR